MDIWNLYVFIWLSGASCMYFDAVIARPGVKVRLVGGRSSLEGRVEVYHDNVWGTVCDDDFDILDARVFCFMLGYERNGAQARHGGYFGIKNKIFWLDDLACNGTETSVEQCYKRHGLWGSHNCQPEENAGIVCQPKVRLIGGKTEYEGRIEIHYLSTWVTVCDDNFRTADAQVFCNMLGYGKYGARVLPGNTSFAQSNGSVLLGNANCRGNEKSISDCNSTDWGPNNCSSDKGAAIKCFPKTGFRLIGGIGEYEGRVEINDCETVCSDNFTVEDAQAVCEVLGYPRYGARMLPGNFSFGQRNRYVLLGNANYLGKEISISNCNNTDLGPNDCSSNTSAAIKCFPKKSYRLIGGMVEYEGRVEIYDGDWITACNDNFTDWDAQTVCEILGYSREDAVVYYNAYFGQGNLECGIRCRPNINVRLVGGKSEYEGRIEVYHSGRWGTVCDDGFDPLDAKVFCFMLGYHRIGSEVCGGPFSTPGNGQVWLDDLACSGEESSVDKCSKNGNTWGSHNCRHHEDVGVKCKPKSVCKALALPNNGKYSSTSCTSTSSPVGTHCTLLCEDGFKPLGEIMTTCFGTGLWNISDIFLTCLDINECEDGTHLCSQNCRNTPGKYECYCNDGYIRGNDKKSCIVKECPTDIDYRNKEWKRGSAGKYTFSTCPDGYKGEVKRFCSLNAEYQAPVYNCTSPAISEIMEKVLKENTSISSVLTDLKNVTAPSNNTNNSLLVGDLETVNKVMSKITEVLEVNTDNVDSVADYFIETANNILDETTTSSWTSVINEKGSGADTVLENLDRFTEKISNVSTSTEKIKVSKSNLFLKVGSTNACDKELKFPDRGDGDVPKWAEKTLDKIQISCNDKLAPESYSSVIYRNLSKILPSTFVGNSTQRGDKLNAPVMSFSYFPNVEGSLEKPIEITFQLFDSFLEKPLCSFWEKVSNGKGSQGGWSTEGCWLVRFDKQTKTVVCKCNHLTNFAVLMSPSSVKIDHPALSVISLAGCSLSMLCLVITIVIHGYFWRALKSDKTIIGMNLACALFVAYVIFLTGVNKTENKGACTAVAVLLHLVYLVVFFIMLSEGLLLVKTVLFPLNTRKPVIPLLIVSYGLPVIIVAISTGSVALEGYGDENSCWLSTKSDLIWAFLVPVLTIVLINMAIVVMVLRKMFQTSFLSKKSRKEKAVAGARSIAVMMPIMGITWVLGVFSVNEDTVVFQYLFALFNSTQGVLIFIFHCALDKKVQKAFKTQKSKWMSLRSYSNAKST